MIVILIIAVIIAVFVSSYRKNEDVGSKETTQVQAPNEEFKKTDFNYYSNYSDTKYYYRHNQKTKKLERIERSSGSLSNNYLEFDQVVMVFSNDVYERVIISAKNQGEQNFRFYNCSFQEKSCFVYPESTTNLSLSPKSKFLLSHSFGVGKTEFNEIDLKDNSPRIIAQINSYDYKFDYIDPKNVLLFPSATAPGNNPINSINLVNGNQEEIVDKAYDYVISPSQNYLVYSVLAEENYFGAFIYSFNTKTKEKTEITDVSLSFFNKDGAIIYTPTIEENMLRIYTINPKENTNKTLLTEIEFSSKDKLKKVYWINDNKYLITTSGGYSKEITL